MNKGDITALRALVEQIEPGWTVETTNHDYIKDSGARVVTSVDDKTLHEKGTGSDRRSFYYAWPKEGDDFEVQGRTLRTYRQSYGSRVIALTMTFAPPQER
jgi:hypothetical protein